MADIPEYVHLVPGESLPASGPCSAFRAVVVVDAEVTPAWQSAVSDWLVQSGCLYMMAWGLDCSSWDDSVDLSNLKTFDFGEIPDDKFVMTTWHVNEPLNEVFWVAKNSGFHMTIELDRTMLVHIAAESSADEMLRAYDEA